MEDKTCRLLNAIENPDLLPDEELRQILEDTENLELYNLLSKTTDALTETKNPDINKEWACFVQKHNQSGIKRLFFTFITRHAAAILVCLVSSLAVVATSIGIIKYNKNSDGIQEQPSGIEIEENTHGRELYVIEALGEEEDEVAESQNVIFKNEPLGNIIETIAAHYGATVKHSTDREKNLNLYFQWDTGASLKEVIDELNNFEQIKISLSDNVLTIE